MLQDGGSATRAFVAPADFPLVGAAFEYAGLWIPAVIVVAFGYGVVRYLGPLLRSGRALKKATKQLHVSATDDVFPNSPIFLKDLWNDYLQKRLGATLLVGDRVQTTVSPEEVFTEHAVLEGYNRNVAGTLAGVFTGLGILGTFIGLVNGLGTIRSGQPEQVLDSVLGLLAGMSTAFYTSIWGIFFSLLWLLLDRAVVHSVQKCAAHFFQATKVRYPVVSAEWFLHRLYEVEQAEHRAIERSTVLLEEQKAILQSLGTDLATAFEEALQASFSDQFAPALQSVASSISDLQTQLGDRQVDAMNKLVETFQEQLSEQLSGQFEHLTGAMRHAAEWQERVHGELEQLIVRIQLASDGQREVIEKSSAACDRYEESLEQLSSSHELLTSSAEAIKETTALITANLDESAKVLTDALRSSMNWANALTQEVGASAERLHQETAAIAARIEELDAQQDAYREANAEIRTYLAGQLDTMSDQHQSLTSFWSEFRDDLSSVGDGLKESVQEFSVFTSEKLKEIFVRFDSEMATVVEHLGGTLAELREVSEDLPGGVERLRVTLREATDPISDVNRSVGALAESMERLESLGAALRSLQPLGGQLEKAAQQVTGTDRSIIQLNERLEATDKSIAAALARVHGQDGNGAARVPLPTPR